MRKAESIPSKLLLLPLIPALAFGIVEVASRISSTPTVEVATRSCSRPPAIVVVEDVPVKPVVSERPPTLELADRPVALSF